MILTHIQWLMMIYDMYTLTFTTSQENLHFDCFVVSYHLKQAFSLLAVQILYDITVLGRKVSVTTGIYEKQSVYLHSMLAISLPSRSLRSNNDNSLSVPRVKPNTGARVFHCCAPSLWNNLPLSVRLAISVATFKKYLMTHLFELAFPP